MQIEIVLIIIALVPTLIAWRVWAVKDRRSLTGTRKVLFTAGLIGATLALATYVEFAIHTARIGGFKTDFPSLLAWTRPSFWMSVAAIMLCVAGKGQSRAWALISSILVAILWVLPVWGM